MSGKYIRLVKTHDCELPNPEQEVKNGVKTGSLWQCDDCGKVYKLESNQRDGIIWMQI